MASAALHFTESFEAQLDDLLFRICNELQLDDTRYKLAVTHYQAVETCLDSQDSLSRLRPAIYPQGSMRLQTTVKPLVGEEYDLDLVCQMSCGTTAFYQPVDALNLIENALSANEKYAAMIERKNRCIRLNYEHQFHMDILPACPDTNRGGTCLLVPDRELRSWTVSNPKGFAAWFDERARQRTVFAKAEPIPTPEAVRHKVPLKLAVQLLKRERDLRYTNKSCAGPISIVLTTLAGNLYRGEESVSMAVGNILAEIAESVRVSHPRLVVLNPSNRDEDLSERWDSNPNAYREFANGIADFKAQWNALSTLRGIDKLARALERLFGEQLAKLAIEKQARDIESARSRNELAVKKGSGIVTGLASVSSIPVRPNTFYGEAE